MVAYKVAHRSGGTQTIQIDDDEALIVKKADGTTIVNVDSNNDEVTIGENEFIKVALSGTNTPKLSITIPDGSGHGSFTFDVRNNDVSSGESNGFNVQAGNTSSDVVMSLKTRDGVNVFRIQGNKSLGFFGASPVTQRLKASHNNWAALSDVVNALVELGVFDAA